MLNEQRRSISQVTQSLVISVASSRVTEFLEETIKSSQLEMDYLKAYQEGLHVAHASKKITSEQFQTEIGPVLGSFLSP